jgi:hypothetical protein
MAVADPDDLSGGVFIAHHDPNIVYCVPPEGWCQHYIDGYAINNCDDQNPSIMTTEERVWFLLSAWPEDKVWCGTEFGLGEYNYYLFIFTSWGPCSPGGNLEIPTAYWPGPNEGTAIVTTDLAWQGNWEPVYYFTGYYYYYGPGQIPVDVDPPTLFGGWGNCLTPPTSYHAACFPAMGILMDGIPCCPSEPEYVCCIDEVCYIYTIQQCLDLGGEPQPEWPVDCGPPDPCAPEPEAVCCEGEICHIMTQQQCEDIMGEWHPEWDTCDPNPCEYERFVCCVCEDCYIATQEECDGLGGEFHPEWDSCDPNPCPASPAESTSWGTIKAIYR